ncbi:DUF2505 family protein [bacterium]|nr:DUF2505 family protein [bacterium]
MGRRDEIAKHFEFDDTIGYPIDKVWPIYRDRMPKIAEFLPNIRRIDLVSREETETGVFAVLEWHARARLPGVAARLIPENMMMWTDTATWNNVDHVVHFEITVPALSDAVRVSGVNRFEAEGSTTRVRIGGELRIDIDKIHHVPKVILRTVVPTIESFALSLTKPNLMEANRGVERYIAAQKDKKAK